MVRITIALALAAVLIIAGAAVEFDAFLDQSLIRLLVGGIAVIILAWFGSQRVAHKSEQLSKEGLCFAYWDHQAQEPQALTPRIVVGNSRKATRTVSSVDPHVRLSISSTFQPFPAARVNCRTKAILGCAPCARSRLGGLLCRLRLSGLLEQKSESGTGRQSHRDE